MSLLKVFWNDNGKPRKLEIATLRLDGQTYPVPDVKLKQLFKGGAVNISNTGNSEEIGGPSGSTTSTSNNISGSNAAIISGAPSQNISGN